LPWKPFVDVAMEIIKGRSLKIPRGSSETTREEG